MKLCVRLIAVSLLAAGCGDGDGTVDPDATVDAAPDTPSSDVGPDSTVDSAADAAVDDAAVDATVDTSVADASMGPTAVDISDPSMDPRQGYAVGFVGDGRVIFAGGFGGSNTPNESWSFDPSDTSWTQLADLPAPHIGPSSIVLPDGRMLISGGVPGQFVRMTNDAIFVFDLTTSTWSAAGTMTEARGGHSMFMLRRGPDAGKIVMIGGSRRTVSGSDFLTTFELYDPTTMISTTLASTALPAPRASAMHYEMADGRIVIAGGYATPGDPGGSATDEILIYDPMDHSVTLQTARLPEAQLVGLVGTLPDGRGLVFPSRFSARTIYAMDQETFAFTSLGDLPMTRTSYGLALLPSGLVYLFGGREDDVSHNNINRYDPLTDTWLLIEDILPMALAAMQATVLRDGRVVLLGGQTDLGFIVGQTTLFTP